MLAFVLLFFVLFGLYRMTCGRQGRDSDRTGKIRSQCGQAGTLQYVWQVLLSRADGSYSPLGIAGYAQAAAPTAPPLLGDFNGDQCSDLAFVSGTTWSIQYATCWRAGAASPGGRDRPQGIAPRVRETPSAGQ